MKASNIFFMHLVVMCQVRYDSGKTQDDKTRQNSVRVAVYEHIPQGSSQTDEPEEILRKNLAHYCHAVKLASENGVQLLVFPEDSIINSEDYPRKVLIEQILEEMPNPDLVKINLCHRPGVKSFSVLRTISCLALSHRMFIAFSFGDKVRCSPSDPNCPAEGYRLYNTLALFDWNGFLVAKYHKMQLYYEFQYDIPVSDSIRYYDSPFGRLGFVVCIDLMFRDPGLKLVNEYKVDTIIFSTYWFNYVPFVTGVQLQQAFAIVHKINFLSSCVQIPDTGSIGSGIYAGDHGAVAYSNQGDGLSKLIIATIPTNSKSTVSIANPETKFVTVFEDLSKKRPVNNKPMNLSELTNIQAIPLDLNASYTEWCDRKIRLCCRAEYIALRTSTENGQYMMIAGGGISGSLGQIRYPIYQEFCGIAWCRDLKCHRFGTIVPETVIQSVTLSGKFESQYVFPGILMNEHRLLKRSEWKFEPSKSGETRLVIPQLIQPFAAVTLYGRHYDLDPAYYQ